MIAQALTAITDIIKSLRPTDAGRRHRMLRWARVLDRRAVRAFARGDIRRAVMLIDRADRLRKDAPLAR